MATLLLTVIGDDRPGLVSALSAPIEAHGGSWQQSQLSRLAGKFAGIVLVTVPADRVAPLVVELDALAEQEVSIEDLSTDVRDAPMSGGTIFEARAVLVAPAAASAESLRSTLESIGHDLMVEVRLSDD